MECYVYFGMLLTDWEVLLPPVTPLSGIFHSWSRGQHCVWEDSASHVRLQRGKIKIISIFLSINGHRSICHSYFWNVASLKGCMNFEFLYAVNSNYVHVTEWYDTWQLTSTSSYDILVCTTIGHKPMLKERMAVLRDLWAAGLRAEIYLESMQVLVTQNLPALINCWFKHSSFCEYLKFDFQTQEEVQEFCRSSGVSFLVILKDDDPVAKVSTLLFPDALL